MSDDVFFYNEGLIDETALTTMGVNAKDGENPIGYFGTGLKFAIATILRHGGRVVVYRGGTGLYFGTTRQAVRGRVFEVVTMNDRPLGFTTDLGKNWQAWQAYRELYCNALDEDGGGVALLPRSVPAGSGTHTVVHVSGWPAFMEAHEDRHSIVITSEPLARIDDLDVHPGPSRYLYYRGVRAYELPQGACSRYTYNLARCRLSLTEDRTLAHPWAAYYSITSSLVRAPDEDPAADEVLHSVLTTYDKTAIEANAFSWSATSSAPSPAFLRAAETATGSVGARLSGELVAYLRKHGQLTATLFVDADLDDEARGRLDFAKHAAGLGGIVLDNYPIRVVESLGPGVQGLAHEDTIFVVARLLRPGAEQQLVAVMAEEYMHIVYGFTDESREFQNYLLERLAAEWLNKVEEGR